MDIAIGLPADCKCVGDSKRGPIFCSERMDIPGILGGPNESVAELVPGVLFIDEAPLIQKNSGGMTFKRFQLPVKLFFAMTINKSQGQTLDFVGLYLEQPVFAHGQLYVALSRARTSNAVRAFLFPPTYKEERIDTRTKNVVFTEIFSASERWEKLSKLEQTREDERHSLLMAEAEVKQQGGGSEPRVKKQNAVQKWFSRNTDQISAMLKKKKLEKMEEGLGKWGSYLNREQRLDNLVGRKPTAPAAQKGLYLYGNVGSGKAMLMDLFYSSTEGIVKHQRRFNFHEAMLDINERMYKIWKSQVEEKSSESGISTWISNLPFDTKIKNGASIPCVDEIQTVDVFTIVPLSGILSRLLSTGTILVATSNRAPRELNQDGMQKEIFQKVVHKLDE